MGAFLACIKGEANGCKCVLQCYQCNTEGHYTDKILCDVLARGLNDSEIQLDLLGNPNQEMSLEEMFKFTEAKEAGKSSAITLTHKVQPPLAVFMKKIKCRLVLPHLKVKAI